MFLWDCMEEGNVSASGGTQDTHRKVTQVLGIENMKDLAEKSSAPYDLSPKAYICFASFSSCNKLTSPGRYSSEIHGS